VQTQAKKQNPREIQKQADHWKEMYEKLESEHTKVIPKSISRMTGKDKQKLDINEMTRIQTTIRDSIWRKVKFITDNVQAQDICKKIWQYIKSQKRDEALTETTFMMKYADFILADFAKYRTYKMSRMEESFKQYPGKYKPTLHDVVACLERNIQTDDEKMMEIFAWYWDSFLPAALGHSKLYTASERRYATVSECAPKDKPKKKHVTIENEAFAVLTFENNIKKWEYYEKLRPKYGRKVRFIPCKKQNKTDPDKIEECVVGGKQAIRIYSDDCRGQYTLADSGQSKYGGWSLQGLERYNELKEMADQGRENPKCKEIEEVSLAQVRNKYNIQDNAEDQEDIPRILLNRKENTAPKLATWNMSNFDDDDLPEITENNNDSGSAPRCSEESQLPPLQITTRYNSETTNMRRQPQPESQTLATTVATHSV